MRPVVPTMRSLMEDDVFRAYMKKVPSLPPNLRHGNPWQLWLRADTGWLTGAFSSYRDAWPVFVRNLRRDGRDVTLTSRRVFFAPPGEYYKVKVRHPRRATPDNPATTQVKIEKRWRQTFFWDDVRLRWCGRCRRPVYWQKLHSGHHAIRKMPAFTTDDNLRCTICGIRNVAMPSYQHMVKIVP